MKKQKDLMISPHNIIMKDDVETALLQLYLDKDLSDEQIAALKVNTSRIAKAIEDCEKDTRVKDVIFEAVSNLAGIETKIVINGSTLSITPVKTVYDYSICGHTEWNFLNKAIEILSNRKKEIEKELQLLAKDGSKLIKTKDIVITNDIIDQLQVAIDNEKEFVAGEIITIKAPGVESLLGIKVSNK